MRDSSVRDYSFNPLYNRSMTPQPETPPFPDPLDPISYFRNYSQWKNRRVREIEPDVDHRLAITDPHYWKCEAFFLSSLLGNQPDLRNGIRDADYWKCEALFWESRCNSGAGPASRTNIASSDYWRCEADFMGAEWERQYAQPPDVIRIHIQDKEYWECENALYNDIMDSEATASSKGGIESGTQATHGIASTAPQTPSSGNKDTLPSPDKPGDPGNDTIEARPTFRSPHSPIPCASNIVAFNPRLMKTTRVYIGPNIVAKASKRRHKSIDGDMECSGHSANLSDELPARKKRRIVKRRADFKTFSRSDNATEICRPSELNHQADEPDGLNSRSKHETDDGQIMDCCHQLFLQYGETFDSTITSPGQLPRHRLPHSDSSRCLWRAAIAV